MAMIECRGLKKRYSGYTALDSVDLSLESGRIIGLLGPNGAGKTTLLKLAAGLLVPTDGSILIDGKKPGTETKAMVAYLPDRDFLPDHMTVEGILNYYGDFFADFNRSRAEEMLANLNIPLRDQIRAQSKGTREKIQLVLCMSRDAKVYLLDEPIGGVDPAGRDYILRTIINNYSMDALVLISTHLIAEVETLLDEVIFIRDGSIILQGAADEVRQGEGKSIDELFREVFRC